MLFYSICHLQYLLLPPPGGHYLLKYCFDVVLTKINCLFANIRWKYGSSNCTAIEYVKNLCENLTVAGWILQKKIRIDL